MTAIAILTTLYWVLLLGLCAAALVFASLSYRKRSFVFVAAGLILLAIIVAALRPQPPSTIIAVLLSLLGIALSVIGGGPAVNLTLGLAGGLGIAGDHGGILVHGKDGDRAEEPRREVLRGGTTIGILERFATAAAIVAGFPEAIAVIVGIKGVGRFTELNEAEARERFIIGTLVSLIWACACAALVRIALR